MTTHTRQREKIREHGHTDTPRCVPTNITKQTRCKHRCNGILPAFVETMYYIVSPPTPPTVSLRRCGTSSLHFAFVFIVCATVGTVKIGTHTALKGRNNIAQGVNPVYGCNTQKCIGNPAAGRQGGYRPPRGDISIVPHASCHKYIVLVLCGFILPLVARCAPRLPASGFPIPFAD